MEKSGGGIWVPDGYTEQKQQEEVRRRQIIEDKKRSIRQNIADMRSESAAGQNIGSKLVNMEKRAEGVTRQQTQAEANEAKAEEKEHGRIYNYFTKWNRERDKQELSMLWSAAKAGGRGARWTGRQLKAGAMATGAVVGGGAGAVIGKVSEGGDAIIYIVLSIMLYFVDIFTHFNGIKITDFSFFTVDFVNSFLWNGVVLVLLIAYGVIYKPDMRNYMSFVVLVLTGSFIFFLGGFNYGGIFHAIFIIFLYIFLIRPTATDVASANYMTAILVLFDYIGYGLLGFYLSNSKIANPDAAALLANRFILPVWFYYTLVLTHDQKKSWFTSLIIFLVICINVFYFAQAFGVIQNRTDVLTKAEIDQGVGFWKTGLVGMKDFYNKLTTSIKGSVDRGLTYATGGYYEGVVEQNQKEPLGVFLEEINEQNMEYYEDDVISQWWTLKARTLDKEKKIEVALSCFSDFNTDTVQEGKIYPDEFQNSPKNLEVYNLEQRDIECRFKEFQLAVGSRQISLFADFNFDTMAYLKRYFIDLETMRTMNKEGIDILSYYKIVDQEPLSSCTAGPVKLTIGGPSPLTGLTTSYDNKLRIGFNLEKLWEGKISKINNLTVYLPRGIEFDEDLCGSEFLSLGVQKLGEEEVNAYKLTDDAKNLSKRKDQDIITLNCRIKVDSGSVDDVLGITPITIKYFRVTADYNFTLEKTKTISVQREPGFSVSISPEKPRSEENLFCTATDDKENLENVRYQFFRASDSTPLTQSVSATKIGDSMYRSSALQAARDNVVYCEMTANVQGVKDPIKAQSARVTVLDTPPKFTSGLQISPDFKKCSGIAYDEDGDGIKATYQFTINGKPGSPLEIPCNSLVNKQYECIAPVDFAYNPGDTIGCSMTPLSYGTTGQESTTSSTVPQNV